MQSEGRLPRLPYRFQDKELLDQALTHRSVGSFNNERLEFLGDGLLNFVIAAELFRLVPDAEEGDLSRLRASLVRRETLAGVAAEIELGEALALGPGEMKSGGHRRHSILADALEALVGAVYLDAGFEAAREMVLGLFSGRLRDLPSLDSLKDAKTRLQEYLQSRHLPLPEYRLVSEQGPAHRRNFQVSCQVQGLAEPVDGEGRSLRKAEQAAAGEALALLEGGADD